VPMMEVYALFAGRAKPGLADAVLSLVRELASGVREARGSTPRGKTGPLAESNR